LLTAAVDLGSQLFEGSPSSIEVLDAQDHATHTTVGEDTIEACTDIFEAGSEGSRVETAAQAAPVRRFELGKRAGYGHPDEVRGATEGTTNITQEAQKVE
jgi:hypothetical protein